MTALCGAACFSIFWRAFCVNFLLTFSVFKWSANLALRLRSKFLTTSWYCHPTSCDKRPILQYLRSDRRHNTRKAVGTQTRRFFSYAGGIPSYTRKRFNAAWPRNVLCGIIPVDCDRWQWKRIKEKEKTRNVSQIDRRKKIVFRVRVCVPSSHGPPSSMCRREGHSIRMLSAKLLSRTIK